ncbi:hypothetical protein EI94DRAFT_1739024 [Lactarius quietus]|nr:hypothetical protein EI94DRAFT_1739024 [Lactarius quietus]
MTTLQPPDTFPIVLSPEAACRPVKPGPIVVGGDSAGAGSPSVVYDSGLPRLAGGMPIYPWCDFHHSFPSIFLNTDTDIVPATGVTIYKPSTLWPSLSDDVNQQVHKLLRGAAAAPLGNDAATAKRRVQSPADDRKTVVRVTGEVEIRHHIQLNATNDLLTHPLVSLCGLPRLFVVASDREVVRDERDRKYGLPHCESGEVCHRMQ